MRAKMLAASILCVVCASATAAHAAPSPRTVWVVLEEIAPWAFKRAVPEVERLATTPTLRTLETAPLTRPLGGYHNPYETPGLGQSNEFVRSLPLPRHDLNLSAPTQDAAAPATTDQTSKAGTVGTTLGTGTVAGGGSTYCFIFDKCTGKH
ncbi:hypothetical protein JQ621_03805 [Bradyrhizobium manausense]|uniref:hypothetical protein n=1 Tax=Bradyrhizobium manausense TaxID=989370 RepID=UPI001BA62CF9|nr:hypothetical protein [Bradyrhizobium manausense]MBR1086594.1 hypothetical protein [Bradyrhizobium manausense]